MFPFFRRISAHLDELRTGQREAAPEATDDVVKMDEFVTLARFDRPIDAYIAQGRLDTEGIRTELFDNHMMQMDGLYCFALSGIRLRVRRRDREHAQRILATDYSHDLDDVDVGKPEH
ncbi:MAG: putative signal transducing protein [Gammaproteobacteria bacterium]